MEFDINIEQLIMDEIESTNDLDTVVQEQVENILTTVDFPAIVKNEIGKWIDEEKKKLDLTTLVKEAAHPCSCVVHGTVDIKDSLRRIIELAPTKAYDMSWKELRNYFIDSIREVIDEC